MRKIVRSITRRTKEVETEEAKRNYVSSGSTLLNLALSDKHNGGFLPGKVVNIIGDSSSGKTFLALSLLAEAANNPFFDNYELIYDDAEAANEFNIKNLFGEKAYKRILPPSLNRKKPKYSQDMTGFQVNVRNLLKEKKSFIYIQDSFDALTTEQETKHANAVEKAYIAGKESKGTYGMEKAKQASILLRLLVGEIKKTNSLVIIISQTRDNIDPMSFQRQTRAGGRALKFYSSYEMWMAVAKKIKVKIKEKNRQIGIIAKVKITKNKANGKVREADIPIYYSCGVDDVAGCIDFLVSEGHWKKSRGIINAKEFQLNLTQNQLIKTIEENSFENKLRRVVEMVWNEIEEEMNIIRKKRWK